MRIPLFLALLAAWAIPLSPHGACAQTTNQSTNVVRILFGSCNRPELAQPLWVPILNLKPFAWIWLGDIVYADTEDVARIRALYTSQRAQAGYAKLAASAFVMGTWDDHDYGVNDGGSEFPSKAGSQEALLDFLGEPAGSSRRQRKGVFATQWLAAGEHVIRLTVLDTRFHRDPPGPDGDVLGEEQWNLLAAALADTRPVLHVIGTSIQAVAEEHRFEKWANFPKARARLLELIGASRARGVVLISGDRHRAELSRLEGPPLAYPLYDLTSSGMTHAGGGDPEEPNKHRVGQAFMDLNFGEIELGMSAKEPRVTLRARDKTGKPVIEHAVPLSDLAPK